VDVLRTPDECFVGLPGYSFEPRYVEVSSPGGTAVRVHYIDEGSADGEVVARFRRPGSLPWCCLRLC
jgi:haloalkane dehalogenase